MSVPAVSAGVFDDRCTNIDADNASEPSSTVFIGVYLWFSFRYPPAILSMTA